jgi:hypothetical protein
MSATDAEVSCRGDGHACRPVHFQVAVAGVLEPGICATRKELDAVLLSFG